jgi:ketosteroid isomerase-like protein
VRGLWQAFQAGVERGDPGAWLDLEVVADNFEWVMQGGLDGKSVWRGRDEYVEFLQTWTAEFPDWSVRVERLIDAGPDRVVALTHQTGTGRASGAPVELSLGQITEFEGGRVIRVTNYSLTPTPSKPPGCRSRRSPVSDA